MSRSLVALLLGMVTLFPMRAASQQDARAQAADEIRRLRSSSNAAIARHDTAGIGAILAPHAVVVASTSAQFPNRAAMLASFATQFATSPDVTYERSPAEVHVYLPWGMASELGEWRGAWTEPDGKVAIGGRYFAKWRRLEGRWLVESETYVPERCSGSTYCGRVP